MALRELQAMQAAYELLSPLDPSAQQRVLTWVSAALADTNGLAKAADEPAAPVQPIADLPADIASPNNVADAATEPATALPDVQTAAPAPPTSKRRRAAAEPQAAVEPEPVAQPAPAPLPKRSRPAKTTGRPAAKATESSVTAASAQTAPRPRGERPTGEQFLTDLTTTGSFKALAQKYGKSVGTIGNWANQLREQGFDIPVGRQKKA
jgi:hypothetical protein